MLKTALYAALMVWISLFCSPAESGECCTKLRLDVTQKIQADRQINLVIKLTNASASAIRFSIGSGPWVGPNQIQFVALRLPLGTPVPNDLRSMRDPALGYISIDPGKAREEEVPLAHLYPELAAELLKSKGDFALFWTYRLQDGSILSERVGGWLLIKGTG